LRDRAAVVGHGRGGSFAGAPGESVRRIAPFSTLLPQLPNADLDAFRIAFAGGCIALLVLVIVGAYPVALVGAAVLVPALVLLYVYSVDVYEDTPLTGIAFTVVWGVVWGILFGIATSTIAGTGARFGGDHLRRDVFLGVVVPLAGAAMMVIGPIILMRDRRFNDVVDGATFGVAAAVSFVGARVIVGSIGLFAGGLTPIGEPLPWLTTIIAVGIAQPVVAAGAIGSTVGAFWLRYRAPIRDRAALGAAGGPAVAAILAGALLVASALATFLPGAIVDITIQLVLAAVALVWLRRTLHLGLLEEAFELEIGDEITCANCGKATRRHTFCGNCGIALHALPKRRPARRSREPKA
jgi:ribosomal protein L32